MADDKFERYGDRDGGDDRGDGGPGFRRRKVSRLYTEMGGKVDYRDPQTLKYFITERGKVVPRRISKVSAKDQRKITLAVKRARALGLMPFQITQ